jgi:hypothetical protein
MRYLVTRDRLTATHRLRAGAEIDRAEFDPLEVQLLVEAGVLVEAPPEPSAEALAARYSEQPSPPADNGNDASG